MDKRFWGWLTSVPSLVSDSEVTNEEQLLLENKVNSVQRKVFINNVKTGETTKAYQNITTYPDGSMSILQKNLTTGEISLQKINPLGQRIFETSFTPYEANTLIGANSSSKMLVGNGAVSQSVISRVSYQTGNNSLVLYDKTPVPVATNGTLVPPLTTNRALATVPLLRDGAVSQVASKVGQVQNNRLPYKSVLTLPVKYPIKSESGVTLRGANNTKKNVSSTDTSIPKIEVETPNIKDNSFNKLKPINLDKLKVIENSTPEKANLYWRENAGCTNKPYDENYEVKLVKNNGEKFVRVYTPSMGTRKASAWFMREKYIIGLTQEEIKDKYALLCTPTHVVDVKIGSVTIRTGVVKEVEGWGKGKGKQFDTNGTRLSEKQFINEREIGEKYEKK